MRNMLYEIKMANAVYNPTIILNNPGQLSLKTEQNLPEDEQITYIDFFVDNDNRLYLKKEGQSPQILTSENLKVSDFHCKYLSSATESIKIYLTLTYDSINPEYQYSYQLTSSASIRK